MILDQLPQRAGVRVSDTTAIDPYDRTVTALVLAQAADHLDLFTLGGEGPEKLRIVVVPSRVTRAPHAYFDATAVHPYLQRTVYRS